MRKVEQGGVRLNYICHAKDSSGLLSQSYEDAEGGLLSRTEKRGSYVYNSIWGYMSISVHIYSEKVRCMSHDSGSVIMSHAS